MCYFMMPLLRSILLTTCTFIAMTEACADSQNQEPRFCWGKQLLSQKYCNNVINLDRWTCFGGSSLGCACKTTFRADDGLCVEEHECEDHVRKDRTAATIVRMTTEAVPVVTNDYHDAAVTFLKTEDRIQLLMISEESWHNSECECIKSGLFARGIDGAERTLECYKYVMRRLGKDRLIKLTAEIDFDVKSEGGTKIILKRPDRPATVPYRDHPPFNLKTEYGVLNVTATCMVVTFGPEVDGQPQCMVWGKEVNDIEQSECYNISSSCANMYTVWESKRNDHCLVVENEEKRSERKAAIEAGMIIE